VDSEDNEDKEGRVGLRTDVVTSGMVSFRNVFVRGRRERLTNGRDAIGSDGKDARPRFAKSSCSEYNIGMASNAAAIMLTRTRAVMEVARIPRFWLVHTGGKVVISLLESFQAAFLV
jgi:hypothetical protein